MDQSNQECHSNSTGTDDGSKTDDFSLKFRPLVQLNDLEKQSYFDWISSGSLNNNDIDKNYFLTRLYEVAFVEEPSDQKYDDLCDLCKRFLTSFPGNENTILSLLRDYNLLNHIDREIMDGTDPGCFDEFIVSKRIIKNGCRGISNEDLGKICNIDLIDLTGSSADYCNFLINDCLFKFWRDYLSRHDGSGTQLFVKSKIDMHPYWGIIPGFEEVTIEFENVFESELANILIKIVNLVLSVVRPGCKTRSSCSKVMDSKTCSVILDNLRDYHIDLDILAHGFSTNDVQFKEPGFLEIQDYEQYMSWLDQGCECRAESDLRWFSTRIVELIDSDADPNQNLTLMNDLWIKFVEIGKGYAKIVLNLMRDYSLVHSLKAPNPSSFDDTEIFEYLASKEVFGRGLSNINGFDVKRITGIDLRSHNKANYKDIVGTVNHCLSNLEKYFNSAYNKSLEDMCPIKTISVVPYQIIGRNGDALSLEYRDAFSKEIQSIIGCIANYVLIAYSGTDYDKLSLDGGIDLDVYCVIINAILDCRLVSEMDLERYTPWIENQSQFISFLGEMGTSPEQLNLKNIKKDSPDTNEDESELDLDLDAVEKANSGLDDIIDMVNDGKNTDDVQMDKADDPSEERTSLCEAYSRLTEYQKKYLVSCLTGAGSSEFRIMRELLETQINKMMESSFGDSIVQNGEIIEDYLLEMERIVNAE